MDYLFSILVGFGLSLIIFLAPIFVSIFGSSISWLFYLILAISIPFVDLGLPQWPFVLISIVAAYQAFKINDLYYRTQAMSNAPEWAARSQVTYLFVLIASYVVSLIIL